MAINKKLIHFKNKENFDSEVANGNILDNSIVFIQDTKEISTHGTLYKTVNWSVLEETEEPVTPNLITFTLTQTTYNETVTKTAEEGMTWEEWVNSNYDTYGAFNSRVYISYNQVLCESYNICLGNTHVLPTDIIQEGAAYNYKGNK